MFRDKVNLVLVVGIVMAICGILVFSSVSIVKAQGTETTIHIVGKTTDALIGTITFPEGEPSDVISNPYSDVDSGGPQLLDGTTLSEPVVRLRNTSGGSLIVWIEATVFTNGVVASQRYELVPVTTINVNAVTTTMPNTSTTTGVTMNTGTYKALYLQVTLSSQYGKSGASTLTILGE